MKRNKMFITDLGKCTQIDARPIQNSVYEKYLNLLEKRITYHKNNLQNN